MAATYKSQILHMWLWKWMMAAATAALSFAQSHADDVPEDGLDLPYPGRDSNIIVNVARDDETDGFIATIYLGHLYRESPSGSFYAPWSAIPDKVRDADVRWYSAFEDVARRYGFEPQTGEGDPTDTYLAMYAPFEDDALALASYPDDIGAK